MDNVSRGPSIPPSLSGSPEALRGVAPVASFGPEKSSQSGGDGKLCGLNVRRNTLAPNRATLQRTLIDIGPYGHVEDFSGWIEIEILPSCILSDLLIEEAAKELADKELPNYIEVGEWEYRREGNVIFLRPREFWEIDPVTKFHRTFPSSL